MMSWGARQGVHTFVCKVAERIGAKGIYNSGGHVRLKSYPQDYHLDFGKSVYISLEPLHCTPKPDHISPLPF